MKNVIRTILIIILGLFLWSQCVSVRIVSGEDNGYEGATKNATGVESNINKRDSL